MYSTGNSIQYLVRTVMAKEYKKECIYIRVCVYIAESLCYNQKLTQHCKSTILPKILKKLEKIHIPINIRL